MGGKICFVFFAFTEAAALRPSVLRFSICMRPDSHTQLPLSAPFFVFVSSFFPLFVSLEVLIFPSIFVPLPFSLCMKSTAYVFFFWMVFFYPVTTGWIFFIILCENSAM